MKRLLNVAITRARRRLVIVGDFAWCLKKGGNAFLGKKLLPFLLRHHKPVDALTIVPNCLLAKVAKAQLAMHGGEVEPDCTRIVLTQSDFYRLLLMDLSRTKQRAVIFSPFMTHQRVSSLGPTLRIAIDRGVRIFVVTKPIQERKRNEVSWYKQLENMLKEWGVTIIHKRGMHEKLVFLDNNILWSGSLNPLSFSNTQEILERRVSTDVVADFAETLRLDDLLGAFTESSYACPFCDGEMIAAEGGGQYPFYWRCVVDGCYKRGVNVLPLMLIDGLISFKCGGAPSFGKSKDRRYWFCDCGRRHQLPFHTDHLRLPKMVALIPEGELRLINKQSGTVKPADVTSIMDQSELDLL